MKKTINSRLFSILFCVAFLGLWACSSDSGTDKKPETLTLSADINKIDFQTKGNTVPVKVTTNATAWTATTSDATWIQLSQLSGGTGTTTLNITASENTATATRTAVITISSYRQLSAS